MDFDHLSDADLDRMVDAARSGKADDWLQELQAELALGPVDAHHAAGVVSRAALAAREVHEATQGGNVVPFRRSMRAKAAALVSAVVIVNVAPIAAADEVPFEPRYSGSVVESIRSGLDSLFEPASSEPDGGRAVGTADEVDTAAPPTTDRPTTTRRPTTTTEPEVDPAAPPTSGTRPDPDYLKQPLELTPEDPDPTFGTPPTPDEICEAVARAELDPADAGVECDDPADPADPGEGDGGDDGTVLPPPPPPITTTTSPPTTEPSGDPARP